MTIEVVTSAHEAQTRAAAYLASAEASLAAGYEADAKGAMASAAGHRHNGQVEAALGHGYASLAAILGTSE